MSHGHSHGGGCSCESDHSDAPERGLEYGLFRKIDLDKLQCLNESREGSGRSVFRAWEERHDRSLFVESDDDEELLFNIPFKNVPHMSFGDTGREADQTFSLNIDVSGNLEYPTKISRFSNVSHLSIHISKNFGAENTKIYYIGLRGEWTEAHRHEVTICNYEATANPTDHKVSQITPQTHFIS
ncbi:PITH domain-containing protein 1 isoform X2 [Xenopus tropicalis]|uniref:PITH domain-containing protein 1 isoform X2 n=1 Tax=Xenopus tropicalis TaxID=8364 RepID=A0A8J0R0D9_XENTR|nr:PITH domain-containing protein 1 isoform X2 [Xenopus tropicalis]|eukprot:XP_004911675.1 PREDICTED: PITH domain-containing protein 1 isoform X2 [Xenopus tropicalis]